MLLLNRYPVFPVLNVALMKPEKLSLHAQSAMTPPVSPVARRTRAERHQSVLVTETYISLFKLWLTAVFI